MLRLLFFLVHNMFSEKNSIAFVSLSGTLLVPVLLKSHFKNKAIREHLQTNVKYILAFYLPNYVLAWKCTFLETFLLTGPLASGNWVRRKLIQIPALLHPVLCRTPCGKQTWKISERRDGTSVQMLHANDFLHRRRLISSFFPYSILCLRNKNVQIWALCVHCWPCQSLLSNDDGVAKRSNKQNAISRRFFQCWHHKTPR